MIFNNNCCSKIANMAPAGKMGASAIVGGEDREGWPTEVARGWRAGANWRPGIGRRKKGLASGSRRRPRR